MDAPRIQELSDDELNAYILARLKMAGVDLSVLPAKDDEAPADQDGILAAARRFLRTTPPAIVAFEPDVEDVPPTLYPAAESVPIRREAEESREGGDGR